MKLNLEQLAAVEYFGSPLLIVAGAGTGKTSTIVAKIIQAIESKYADYHEVLATTFTNKAADELKHRLIGRLGAPANKITIGTFHSISLDMLQTYYNKSNKVISVLPYEDQLQIVRSILLKMNLKDLKPGSVLEKIQSFKEKQLKEPSIDQRIIMSYQAELEKDQMMDFADLLLKVVEMFTNEPTIRKEYQARYKLICIDEYQDINDLQHQWMQLLINGENQLCCVGDSDQAIYSFRGANASHILNFNKHFHNAKIVKLECNYRSNSSILKHSNQLIAYNKNRIEKNLYPYNQGEAKPIEIKSTYSSRLEAICVSDKIAELLANPQNAKKSVAILVRSRLQIPDLEEGLLARNIKYVITGSTQLLDRSEVKDLLSYFRFLYNPNDSISFKRMMQSPRRGIGQVSLDKILEQARHSNLDLYQSIKEMVKSGPKALQEKLQSVVELLDKASVYLVEGRIAEAAEFIYTSSTYIDHIDESRRDHVRQWVRVLTEFSSLKEYMQKALLQDTNTTDEVQVSLMTIHAAKGLEFDYVFLPGWEEGILPHEFARSNLEIEEERRLAYVALTRAKEQVYISYAASRFLAGKLRPSVQSRFIKELGKANNDNFKMNNAFSPGMEVAHSRFGFGMVEYSTGEFTRVRFLDSTKLVETMTLRKI